MTNTINVSVTNSNMSPRFIEVGAEGQTGVIKLSLSFDEGWSGLIKSVVFYDKRRIKTVSYEFLGVDSEEVEIPSAILSEDGRHPFIIVGSEVVGDSIETAREIPRKITECAFVCVGDSIYPELNSTVIEALDTDAYSSFLEAYFGCLETADELKAQYAGLSEAIATASGYATESKANADNAKGYSDIAVAEALKAEGYKIAAEAAKDTAVEKAGETATALSEMSFLYGQGKDDIDSTKEEVKKIKDAVDKAKKETESARSIAEGYSVSCGENASNAGGYANQANDSANTARSYAVGHTGTRENEDTDNAKYYSEVARNAAVDLETGVANAEAFKVAAQKSAEEANTAYESASEMLSVKTAEVNEAKAATFEARDDALYANSEAKSARDEAVEIAEMLSGTVYYMGEVSELPETAKKGQIYKLSADYRKGQYVVPTTNVYNIETSSPSEGFSKISAGGAVEALLTYVREGALFGSYGDFPNHHYYYNGQRYSIPLMVSYEDAMIVYTDTIFESLLLSGNPIVCDLTYVSEMPKVLANCFVGVSGTKGMCFIWDGSSWKSLDADFATLADKSVTTDKIADKAVTGAKLADYSVSSNKINGSIPVGKGGTGRSQWDAYKMIYPSSATAFSQLSFPTAESVLCQKTSGAPYWKFLSEIGGSGGGGYKKIGYTDDCDYKVSASSGGKAAFDAAIADASDGDTIIVMMGTYSYSGSNKDLSVNKNINIVGIGTPTITFNVTTTLDDVVFGENGYIESWTSHTTSWSGFAFKGNFTVDCRDGADRSAQSTADAINCMFYGNSLRFSGTYTNCVISTSSSISSGCYYGNGSEFFDCNITCTGLGSSGWDTFKSCDIRISKSSFSGENLNYGGASYDGCNLYLLGTGTINLENGHGSTSTMQNTTVYCSAELTFDGDYYMERTNCRKVTLTSF